MRIAQIARGENITLELEDHAQVKELLNQLHDYYSLSWHKIAELPAINPPGEDPIPFSTLIKIVNSRKVPLKWRARFGIGAIDNRPRTMIHKENMRSTAQTLKNHVTLENRIELIGILREQIIEELKNGF